MNVQQQEDVFQYCRTTDILFHMIPALQYINSPLTPIYSFSVTLVSQEVVPVIALPVPENGLHSAILALGCPQTAGFCHDLPVNSVK